MEFFLDPGVWYANCVLEKQSVLHSITSHSIAYEAFWRLPIGNGAWCVGRIYPIISPSTIHKLQLTNYN